MLSDLTAELSYCSKKKPLSLVRVNLLPYISLYIQQLQPAKARKQTKFDMTSYTPRENGRKVTQVQNVNRCKALAKLMPL